MNQHSTFEGLREGCMVYLQGMWTTYPNGPIGWIEKEIHASEKYQVKRDKPYKTTSTGQVIDAPMMLKKEKAAMVAVDEVTTDCQNYKSIFSKNAFQNV